MKGQGTAKGGKGKMNRQKELVLITCDAGGTMTDIFAVDNNGDFAVGKASTTPHDESIGYWEYLGDAVSHWGMDLDRECERLLPPVEVCIYSGTTVLNCLLQRKGERVGLIATGGHEDILLHERSRHIFAGFGYADRLH